MADFVAKCIKKLGNLKRFNLLALPPTTVVVPGAGILNNVAHVNGIPNIPVRDTDVRHERRLSFKYAAHVPDNAHIEARQAISLER